MYFACHCSSCCVSWIPMIPQAAPLNKNIFLQCFRLPVFWSQLILSYTWLEGLFLLDTACLRQGQYGIRKISGVKLDLKKLFWILQFRAFPLELLFPGRKVKTFSFHITLEWFLQPDIRYENKGKLHVTFHNVCDVTKWLIDNFPRDSVDYVSFVLEDSKTVAYH